MQRALVLLVLAACALTLVVSEESVAQEDFSHMSKADLIKALRATNKQADLATATLKDREVKIRSKKESKKNPPNGRQCRVQAGSERAMGFPRGHIWYIVHVGRREFASMGCVWCGVSRRGTESENASP